VAVHELLDQRLRRRVRHVPTKQEHHTPPSNPTLPNPVRYHRTPVPTSSHGPNSGPTPERSNRLHPNHRRPRMLQSRTIPPLQPNDHGTRHRPVYLDNVYRWFGLPRKVISDRDTRFTSHFGRALAKKLGVDQHMSTAYHPQTDGLAERKNQWIEQYLRLVTSAQPEDWSQWLTIATAVHNDRINSTTGMTPNEALLGYRPLLYPNQVIPSNNDGAEQRMDQLLRRRAQATAAINQVAEKSPTPKARFKEGDQVWLEATHLKLPYHTPKLAPKRQGPFKVLQVVSPLAYRWTCPWLGTSTMSSTRRSCSPSERRPHMARTTLVPHLTSSRNNRSTKWKRSSITDIMGARRPCNISSNG
jgi:transposase InsO family protein